MPEALYIPNGQVSTIPLLDFNNTEIAFRYKTTTELRKSIFLFHSIQNSYLVKIAPPIITWALKWGFPIRGLLKFFFFEQFCGGTTLEDTQKRIEQLGKYGVKSTLDYGVEAEKTDSGYQKAVNEIIRAIHYAQHKPNIAFIALKLTGIGNADVMMRIQKGTGNSADQKELEKIRERLVLICQQAAEAKQSVLIDAEESWIQDVIDTLSEEVIFQYNKNYPVVYTTVQMYRHDRLAYLKNLFTKAEKSNVLPAVKLVRGAYLEKENERAKTHKYPTPMQSTKKNTDADFDAAARFMLERIDAFPICAGTHNEASSIAIVNYLIEKNIRPNHPHVYFSQLFGMSDHISFNLAAKGFNVSKYLPYGPLDAVMPYLFRRAQENTSIAGQTSRELVMLEKELKRRRMF